MDEVHEQSHDAQRPIVKGHLSDSDDLKFHWFVAE